jgi:hypothetical protein
MMPNLSRLLKNCGFCHSEDPEGSRNLISYHIKISLPTVGIEMTARMTFFNSLFQNYNTAGSFFLHPYNFIIRTFRNYR